MSRLVVGVIGHVDHGKTVLVRALTGRDTDRLPEEKARGISIALGFAHLAAGGATIDLIDMPGHERFVRTMIAGATGIDAVLLAVAANEGIKPQTVEHVDIAALLGVRRAVIAVTKTDLVTPEAARAVADEAARLLADADFDPSPPVMTSVVRNEGITDLANALGGLAAGQRPRDADGVMFLPIDRAFSIAGHGPVVTGTLRGATIAAGDMVELLPTRRRVRVRAVQVHGASVTAGSPGERVAVNLRGVEIGALKRGMALAAPGTLTPSEWLTIAIRSVESAPPLRNGRRLDALFGTDEAEVRLRLLDRDVLEPGGEGFAQLRCATPVALPAGEPVILRLPSPARTVAGGRLVEPEITRARRNSPLVLARLEALRDLPPAQMIAAEVARGGATVTHLARLAAFPAWRVTAALKTLPVTILPSGQIVSDAELDHLRARIPPLLARASNGLPQDQLLTALPGTDPALLDEVLARLLAAGTVRKRSGLWLLPHAADDRRRADENIATRIAETLRQAALTPPTPRELLVDPATAHAIDRLLRDGVLIRTADRAKRKEMIFHRDAIAAAQTALAPLLARDPGLLVSDIAAALGISRKYAMPLLDHLDAIRFTRRTGDRRVLWIAATPSPSPARGRGRG